MLIYMGCGSTEDNEEQPPPTRSLIAFSSSRDDSPTTSYYEDIYIMNPDGTDVARFYHKGSDYNPAWSPDGKKIAFWASLPGENHGLRMLDIDSLNIIEFPIVNGGGRLSWSPDGKKIVFGSDQDNDLYIMDTKGKIIQRLAHPGNDADPSWSPDGKKIVFKSDRDGTFGIYIMNADGSDVIKLTESG